MRDRPVAGINLQLGLGNQRVIEILPSPSRDLLCICPLGWQANALRVRERERERESGILLATILTDS